MLRVRRPRRASGSTRYVVNGKEHYLHRFSDRHSAGRSADHCGRAAGRTHAALTCRSPARPADKRPSTLSELMEDYIAAKAQDWTDKRTPEFRNSIKQVVQGAADKPVSAITRADKVGAAPGVEACRRSV